jgi:hypothetical protein
LKNTYLTPFTELEIIFNVGNRGNRIKGVVGNLLKKRLKIIDENPFPKRRG